MTSTVASSKRRRTGNWEAEFYKNGYPKEIIVVDDTPPPEQAEANPTLPYSIIPAPVSAAAPTAATYTTATTTTTHNTTHAALATAPFPMASTASLWPRYKPTGQHDGVSDNATSDPNTVKKRRKTQMLPPTSCPTNGLYPLYPVLPPPPPSQLQPQPQSTDLPYDDKDGHYIVRPGDFLTDRYQVEKQLGQGTFGKVVQCRDLVRRTTCAVKVIRAVQKYKDASKIEIRVLSTIKEHDPLNFNKCIHMIEWFEHRNHVCMVFELLGESVFDFLKKNDYTPFPPNHIQQFAKQLLTSVAFLHQLKLIHTDLKPENILLVDHSSHDVPARTQRGKTRILNTTEIRLIDFGSATFEDDYHSAVVSTRHYRAPEIILGEALFQTHENLEHLAMMQVVLGKIPPKTIQKASREAQKYFKGGRLSYPDANTAPQSQKYVSKLKPLKTTISPVTPMSYAFSDLVHKMLSYDPEKRITARDALRHPFFQVDFDMYGEVVGTG